VVSWANVALYVSHFNQFHCLTHISLLNVLTRQPEIYFHSGWISYLAQALQSEQHTTLSCTLERVTLLLAASLNYSNAGAMSLFIAGLGGSLAALAGVKRFRTMM
jgi:hypothetical protein